MRVRRRRERRNPRRYFSRRACASLTQFAATTAAARAREIDGAVAAGPLWKWASPRPEVRLLWRARLAIRLVAQFCPPPARMISARAGAPADDGLLKGEAGRLVGSLRLRATGKGESVGAATGGDGRRRAAKRSQPSPVKSQPQTHHDDRPAAAAVVLVLARPAGG